MNIVCDKQLLSAAIDGVSRAVTNRAAIPVLEGIMLEATGFQLTLTGYDLEIGITTTIEANVREPGDLVIPAKLFGDVVKRMPAGEITISNEDAGIVVIKGGVAEFEIPAMNNNDYPSLPNTEAQPTFTMTSKDLRDVIEKTLYAVSTDDKKPAHTGELFEIEPDKLTAVALDGYRLAIVERPIQATKDIRVIIPAKTMQEVLHLLPSDEEQPITVCANRRFVVFMFTGYTIMTRLIEGEFLNYRSVLPNGCRCRVTVDSADFIQSIERASLIITERLKNPLRITFAPGRVIIRCQTNLGKVVDELDCATQGDTMEIGFNNRYLLDALRSGKSPKVIFEVSGALSPVKILPSEGNDFTYLVLPVRFKND